MELKIPGTRKWQLAKMILTKEHLILCAPHATAGTPSHTLRVLRQGWLDKLEKMLLRRKDDIARAIADRVDAALSSREAG